MKVLLVDDDPSIRQTLDVLFKSAKIPHDLAASGDQALLLCSREAYQAVVSDLEMPGLNGLELARRLKQYYPDLPLFAFSGSSGKDLAAEAARVFDHIFRKPDQVLDVLSTVRAIMAKAELQAV